MKRPARSAGFAAAIAALLIAGCATPASSPSPAADSPTAEPTGVWTGLQQLTPVPSFLPLPKPVPGPLDATYAKLDPSWPQWWRCARCADYRPAGGIWRLQLEEGVMRIYYEVTGWHSLASFTVSGDELQLFNDPYCPRMVGRYRWRLDGAGLDLDLVDDPCAFGLRGQNLGAQPWLACPTSTGQEPSVPETRAPAGCSDPVVDEVSEPGELPVAVAVFAGDAHHFDAPPDEFAQANRADPSSPPGVEVRFHPGSIAYGTTRVLWWDGDWIEAGTEVGYSAIGIQFWGSPYTGWARVLFDGMEVWRGVPATLGSEPPQFGGYIQISGFLPGRHTLRAESLGVDFRPLTVAFFGFSRGGGVESDAP